MAPTIDLPCDLHAEDDEGLGWALLAIAREPEKVRMGALLVAGTPRFWATVRITAVDDDGQIHFRQLDEDDPDYERVADLA